jgi:hypothetical protein
MRAFPRLFDKMAPKTLQSLPPELLAGIVEVQEQSERLSLSAANSRFRGFLAPYLFRTVRLNRRPDSDFDGLRRVASKYAQYVRELNYVGSVYARAEEGDGPESGNKQPWVPPSWGGSGMSGIQKPLPLYPFLPDTVRDALSGNLFPVVDTVRVSFEFNFEEPPPEGGFWEHESDILGQGLIDFIYVHEIPEEDQNVIREKEAKYPWRALMADVWRVLCQNHSIKNLVATDLMPKPTSTFFSEQWSEFLARLQTLEIRMQSGDNGAGLLSNTVDGYLHFERHLDDYFFKHATHTTSLILAAGRDTPFGCDVEWANCPLPLRSDHLPKLQHLELHEMFLSPDLASFVTRENGSISSLVLYNCHTGTIDEGIYYPWKDFLVGLDRDDVQLKKLDIRYAKQVPMTSAEVWGWGKSAEENPQRWAKIQALRQVPGTMAFSYGWCTDKYGEFWEDAEGNYQNYTKGEDLKAYHSLLARIRCNASESRQDVVDRVLT